MNETTTLSQFRAEVAAQLRLTPSNTAVAKHLAKLERMTEQEWPEHRNKLVGLGVVARPAIKMMVADAMRKTAR